LNSCIVSVLAVALAALPAVTASAGPLVGTAPSLLAATDNPVVDELQTAIRSRSVEIEAVALDALATGRPIELNLFDDLTMVASLRKTGNAGTTGTTSTWRGWIEGEPTSSITLVIRDGLVAASIRVPGTGTFRIRPVGAGQHIVEQIDLAAQLPCGFGGQHAIRIENAVDPAAGGAAAANGAPPVIDVMVVYTPIARAAAGGTAAIETLIDLFMAEANDAYQNSLIGMQVNLVYAGEVDYDESGNHLSGLTDHGDGIMEEVHGLRYAYQADLVALLVNSAGYCGVAWLMPANSVSSEDRGFSVTVRTCGGMVFAHELGHNMGCCHAPGDGGGCTVGGLYSYSVGYRYNGQSGQLWRTVMAYSPGTRIPNFSNPNVLVDNQPTGVSIENPNSAENALTINQTSPTISMYRSGLPFCNTDAYYASDGNGSDFFGFSSDLEGNTAIVGAPLDDDVATFAGSAYMFSFDAVSQVWTEQQKLLASDAMESDSFGTVVALSGPVVVVGAEGADDDGAASGAAYVYRYDENLSQWIEEAKLTASDAGIGDVFGSGLAVDGDVVVVGAPHDDDNGSNSGSAYVFRYDEGTGLWDQEAKLLAFDGQADQELGQAAVVRGDLIIVGAPSPNAGGGAAYVFRFNGSTWDADGKIQSLPVDPASEFGSSMAINGDVVIVGASANTGSATIFREVGGVWLQEQDLTPFDGENNDFFGTSVDVSGDMAIVGAPFDDDFGSGSGSAYVYRYDGLGWSDIGKMMPLGGAQFDFVGYSVGIDGLTSIVGAGGDSTLGSSAGAFHAFNGFTGTDCNGNGTADDCEILAGDVPDTNGNGVPDGCDLTGDIDGDGLVGINDFLALLGAWGPCGDCGACPADLDGDCQVGIDDFLLLLGAWTE
jgi:hypothetical protein